MTEVGVMKQKKADIVVISAILFIFLIEFIIIWFKLRGFLLQSGDTGIAEQALWNTIHGDWFRQSFLENSNNLREHMNFIQVLYLPFYFLIPRTLTLYALIDLVYAGAAIVLYSFSKKRLGTVAGAIITLCYLLNPIVVLTNISAMHVIAVGAPFFLLALIFYEEKRYKLWLTFIILTLITNEVFAPSVFIFGLIIFFDRRELKWFVPPLIGGAVIYILSLFVIDTGFAENKRVLSTFKFSEIFTKDFKNRMRMLEEFFRPALYIFPFLSKYSWLLISSILLDLFIVDKSRLSSGSHVFTLFPVVIIFSIVDYLSRKDINRRKIVLAALVIGTIISVPVWISKIKIKPVKRAREMGRAVQMVKDGGSVTASRDISYNLSRRRELYLIDNQKFSDYVVLDMSFWDSKDTRFKDYVSSVQTSDQYVKAMDKNDIEVFIKKDKFNELKSKKLIK